MHENDSPPPSGQRRDPDPVDPAMLRALLENAPAYILLLGPDRRIWYVNRVSYGFTLDQVIGEHYSAFVPPDQSRKHEIAFDRSLQTRQEQTLEYYFDTPGAGRQWAFASTSALFDEGGEHVGYINIVTEITAQKRAEEKLEKAQADLADASRRAGMAEVATGVLHNVGNVLNSVNVSACTLLEQVDALHVGLLERAVGLMNDQGEALAEFIATDPKGQKLPLLLSRITEQLVSERDAMRVELQRLMEHINIIRSTIAAQQSIARSGEVLEPLEIEELIDRALSMVRVDMERQNIELTCEIEELPALLIDKQGTLQVLANLVRNAVEALAGAAHPQMVVKAHAKGDKLTFEIEDNGCGIAADDLTRIFRHGFTTKQSGHGFGLHASAIAAQAMGGSLTATSAGPGRGASFCLTLPRRDAPTR